MPSKRFNAGQSHLQDVATRQQVFLERLKAGQIRDFAKAFDEISGEVKNIFAKQEGLMSDMTKAQLRSLQGELASMQQDIFGRHIDQYMSQLEDMAGYISQAEARALKSAATRKQAAQVYTPQAQQAFQRARIDPIHIPGTTNPVLQDFVDTISNGAIARMNAAVIQGYDMGDTVPMMLRKLLGTGRLLNKDGLQEVTRRQSYTVLRTATQHVANTARELTWTQNDDLVKGVIWVSTLDSRTTIQCQALDGQRFKLGEGPRPPVHPNCRSTTAPWMDQAFDFLDEGATRSSMQGYVDQSQSYYDWLDGQSEGFQDEVLGPTRGKLFRDGGLTNEDFAKLQLDRNWEPMTLDEMRKVEPLAFERAGIPF